ncbi:hypothetical protein NLI96_g7847 [Meripilus lineatus]|uniref:Uncharacterized protein n=1 Tax=Meripilus lineatus TaxID=2056292 RepID=A0AAD5UYF0_9APHY|nr:hypothetical protein NLI96_g7847 [Physisporinus lineatus]
MYNHAPLANARDLVQSTIQANKDHQYSLKVYSERLEAELATIDKYLAIAEQSDEDLDVDAGGSVVVSDSVKAARPFPLESMLQNSSMAHDSACRQAYLAATVIHPMKGAELEALSTTVTLETQRASALESQRLQMPIPGLQINEGGTLSIDIDWQRVATRVSSSGSSGVQRTAQECEIRWKGGLHPQFNRDPWTPNETSRVRELVDGLAPGEINWDDVARKLGTNRTPIDCMRNSIVRRVHVWTPESDARLLDAVRLYGVENWSIVARLVSEDATAAQCQGRYSRSLNPDLKKGTWSADEDEKLRRAVDVFGHSWTEVCQFIHNRSSEQCRDRWQDALCPSVSRSKWVDSEDKALLSVVEEIGEGKWKEVSQALNNGRTDSMVSLRTHKVEDACTHSKDDFTQCRNRYQVLKKRKPKGDHRSPSLASSDGPVASSSTAKESTNHTPPTKAPRRRVRPVQAPEVSTTMNNPGSDVSHQEVGTRKKNIPRPRRIQRKVPEASEEPSVSTNSVEQIENTPTMDEASEAQTQSGPSSRGKRPTETESTSSKRLKTGKESASASSLELTVAPVGHLNAEDEQESPINSSPLTSLPVSDVASPLPRTPSRKRGRSNKPVSESRPSPDPSGGHGGDSPNQTPSRGGRTPKPKVIATPTRTSSRIAAKGGNKK